MAIQSICSVCFSRTHSVDTTDSSQRDPIGKLHGHCNANIHGQLVDNQSCSLPYFWLKLSWSFRYLPHGIHYASYQPAFLSWLVYTLSVWIWGKDVRSPASATCCGHTALCLINIPQCALFLSYNNPYFHFVRTICISPTLQNCIPTEYNFLLSPEITTGSTQPFDHD